MRDPSYVYLSWYVASFYASCACHFLWAEDLLSTLHIVLILPSTRRIQSKLAFRSKITSTQCKSDSTDGRLRGSIQFAWQTSREEKGFGCSDSCIKDFTANGCSCKLFIRNFAFNFISSNISMFGSITSFISSWLNSISFFFFLLLTKQLSRVHSLFFAVNYWISWRTKREQQTIL